MVFGNQYLESDLECKFERQTFESNSEFLSFQDPEEDRAVGAKDASRWCLPILLPIVRKLSREGENMG